MQTHTRREVIQTVAAATVVAGLAPLSLDRPAVVDGAAFAAPPTPTPPKPPQHPKQLGDRDFVIGAGMTEQEADCWAAIADAAGKFFDLPEMHPMDRQEIASAIHIVQNKLLSRPTYRKYLELAKAARGG